MGKKKVDLGKGKKWEYYSAYSFYLPLVPYFLYQALRGRHPVFFSATNPAIFTGGMGMESKYETLMLVPKQYRPDMTLFKEGADINQLESILREAKLSFPLIAKPDVGFRGLLVKKVDDIGELRAYLQAYPIDFMLQEFIDLPEEVGVLHYRFPDTAHGEISSLTLKSFLSVEGNGHSSLLQLIQQKGRALRQLKRLEETHAHLFDTIPAKGTKIPLGEIGNHCKGTTFLDGGELIDEKMVAVFDKINEQIEGVFYGRYDLRCSSIDDLRTGKGLKILEMNGVGAEPTHVYDPRSSSYFKILGGLIKQWRIIRQISLENRKRGATYLKPWPMIQSIIGISRYVKKIKKMAAKEESDHSLLTQNSF